MYSEPVLNSPNVYEKLKQTSKYYQVKNLMLDLLSPAVIPLHPVLLFCQSSNTFAYITIGLSRKSFSSQYFAIFAINLLVHVILCLKNAICLLW